MELKKFFAKLKGTALPSVVLEVLAMASGKAERTDNSFIA